MKLPGYCQGASLLDSVNRIRGELDQLPGFPSIVGRSPALLKVLDEIASKVLRTYWSIASFQSLYARANDWAPAAGGAGSPTALDRWAISRASSGA